MEDNKFNDEDTYRLHVVDLIFSATRELLQNDYVDEVASVGATFFHKYVSYMGLSCRGEDELTLLAALLFLTCKVTEFNRTQKLCIAAACVVKNSLGIMAEETEVARLSAAVIDKEHTILRMLAFNTEVDLPQKYIKRLSR